MNERDWAAVGRCISQRLAELEWTQHELAARSGISQAIIRELQLNTVQRKRSPRTLEALSTTLGLHPHHLAALRDEHTPLPLGVPTDQPEPLAAIEQRLADINSSIRDLRLGLAKVLYLLTPKPGTRNTTR
ncbi:helix-turn-helix domain-containing protein [Actinokineospora diospyrosa]|uniref:Helix-turn-helix protein n=1 Tax=Actinokineospora diospyrosa TaxID=103728 RepID=A0ABT1I9F1_9PSEU|nr:helix-turn-helix transcriptional regulator [Actinokineospora diospyrosa]MCP2269263.1 helix-turn-helix protein [Actinokineospora diospyrosa]